MITTYFAGVGYRPLDSQAHFRKLPAGTRFTLNRDPDNPHDGNAIEIWHDDYMVAFVPARVARNIAEDLDNEVPYIAELQRDEMSKVHLHIYMGEELAEFDNKEAAN